MQHSVRKQILELELEGNLDTFRLQQDMAGFYQDGIMPVLEKLFDELSNDEMVIEIDRLEIDLGLITAKEIERKSVNNLYATISSQVKEVAGNTTKILQHAALHTTHTVVHSSKVLSTAKQWLFYMQHGYLAWNTISINEAWCHHVLEAFATDFESTTALRRLILTHPRAIKRMVYQHTEIFLRQLIEILTAEKQMNLPVLINDLTRASLAGNREENEITDGEKKIIRERIWIVALTLAAKGQNKLPGKIKITKEAIRQMLKEGMVPDKSIAAVPEEVITKAVQQTGDDGIFVRHAGVVLLHPFLHSFFKRLQLTQQTEFISIGAHQKAVFMIYFLSTGFLPVEEHELVIAKLLCGFSMEEPMPKDIELNELEITEVNNLLAAAIGQWEILKNTSAAGLREGFLQRNGKLYLKNDTLYLQMETNSIDIVLDYLPWNLSMIKLPWMKDMLRVEWR